MLPLYQKFKNVRDWDEPAIQSFIDHLYRQYGFTNLSIDQLVIDREEFRKDLMELQHKGTIRDFLKSINYYSFSVYKKEQTLQIGDKNPLHSIYAKRLLKIFPDARFICIVRDYRDTFVSLRNLGRVNVEAPLLSLQMYRWRYVVRLFRGCCKKYPERFRIIRYEDLITDQERIFQMLSDFIGIPYDPGVFQFYQQKEEVLKIYDCQLIDKFHRNLMNPINTGRMNLWKTELTPVQIHLADQIAGRYADLFGYERESKRFHPGLWLKSIPMTICGFLLFRVMYYGSFLPYKASMWLTNLQVLVKVYDRFLETKKSRVHVKK